MLILQQCSAWRCFTKIYSALSQSALSPCARRNFKNEHLPCGGTNPLCSAHFCVPVGCASRNGTGIVGCTSRSSTDPSGLCGVAHKSSASSSLAIQLDVPEHQERRIPPCPTSSTLQSGHWIEHPAADAQHRRCSTGRRC